MTEPMAPIPFLDRLGEQLDQAGPARRRPPVRLLTAAAVVLLVLVGIGAALTFRSEPVSAGVAVTHGQGTVKVRLFGKAPTGDELEDILHRNGLDGVTIEEVPAAPRYVGQLFLGTVSAEAEQLELARGDEPLTTLGRYTATTPFDTIVFPTNWRGELGLRLGRAAHGHEAYFYGDDALRQGGLLACMYGATPRQVLAAAERRGLRVVWRQRGALTEKQISEEQALALRGWRVFDGSAVDDRTVNLRLTEGGQPVAVAPGTPTTLPDPRC